ncbi:MAG: 2-phospho-L-lactate guanylyltransferase [Candidatus Hydrothermarchaeaceae archaeon]
MRTSALIPVKLRGSKTRLAGVLLEEERADLVKYMLLDVMDAVKNMDGVVIVGPREIDDVLKGHDFELIVEEEASGLNNAVKAGNKWAMDMGVDATLFVPADTPLIRKRHIDEILELGGKHPLIISPSRRGGTGVLFRRPPDIIGERFTSHSYSDYQAEAKERGVEIYVYDSFALSLDIDTPEDIGEFMLHGEGTRTHAFLDKTRK